MPYSTRYFEMDFIYFRISYQQSNVEIEIGKHSAEIPNIKIKIVKSIIKLKLSR